MRKKHGTIRTAVRPFGSVNRDRFGRFGLFQPLNDVVQLLFFFPPKRRRSETAPADFFSPLYGVVLPSLKITLLKPFLISQSLSTLTRLCLSQKSLSNPHTLKSQSLPCTVAAQPLSLAPSHCRSLVSSSLSRCCLSPTSPSQRSLDRSSLVAVTPQPRYFIYGITNTKDSELQ